MNNKLRKDGELLERIREADKEAFREIYVRYSRDIFLQAYKKVKDRHVAEELTQNLFLTLWERRKEADIQNLRAWLMGAVKFAVINHYKAQMMHAKYESYVRGNSEVKTYTTEQLAMLKDLSVAIDKGVSLLPVKTQQVFKLSRFENRSIKEIARDLNISEKAVEYHITQSLKWMRLYLKDFLTGLLLLTMVQ